MYINAGSMPIDPEGLTAVSALLEVAREATLREPGVRAYEFAVDLWDPATVRFFEVYEDREAFEQHMVAPHTRELFAGLRDHLTGRATMTGYEATEFTA